MPQQDWLQHVVIVVGIALGLALFLSFLEFAGHGYSGALERSQFVLSVAQAIGTVLAAFAAGGAAWAAAGAARSAHQGVALASLTAERQLRAYVACADVLITDVNPDMVPNFAIEIRNAGATPAHEVQAEYAIFLDAFPQTTEMVDTVRAMHATHFGIIDSQHYVTSRKKAEPLADVAIEAIAEEILALYVVVAVTYRDVFGKRCRSKRWHMYTAENRKMGKPGALICPYGHSYAYDIGEQA